MINIFFLPGTFGSTVEYVLRSHTQHYSIDPVKICPDGSMHGFKKMAHITNAEELKNYFKTNNNSNNIQTIIYPFKDLELDGALKACEKYQTVDDKNILLYYDTFESGEKNLLFQYHKIAIGLDYGLDCFADSATHDFTGWDANFDNWRDLQPWQFREWFSIFYPSRINFLIQNSKLVNDNFLKITSTNLLFNTKQTLENIINFCGLTLTKNLDVFVQEWQSKQQYILQEYTMLCTIVENTIKNQTYTWPDLNIISQSIVQQKLQQQGYGLKCDGLNKFPTDALELHSLLEPTWRTE